MAAGGAPQSRGCPWCRHRSRCPGKRRHRGGRLRRGVPATRRALLPPPLPAVSEKGPAVGARRVSNLRRGVSRSCGTLAEAPRGVRVPPVAGVLGRSGPAAGGDPCPGSAGRIWYVLLCSPLARVSRRRQWGFACGIPERLPAFPAPRPRHGTAEKTRPTHGCCVHHHCTEAAQQFNLI